MHEPLIKYISNHAATSLSENETEVIKNSFIPKKIRRRQYFLQEGEVCKYLAFITKGAMRQYSVDNKGVEHIIGLYIENWWAGDRESYVMPAPSAYNIDAWENTEVLLITRPELLNLMKQIPAMVEMKREIGKKNLMATQRRLNTLISLSAEERFADLASSYPEFLQRFPQHIIASYLGITKETLSRIRKQAMAR